VQIHEEVLQPVVALAAWTMVMWFWMYATRLPAIAKLRMRPDRELPRGEQMAQLPARVRWKADNYDHLLEQPTVFYVIAVIHALRSHDPRTAAALAWTYVGLRVLHSLVQALVNWIELRFAVFVLSTIVLIVLIVGAANSTF
jgi:hypothetical protein